MAITDIREALGAIGLPRADVAALFAVAPRAERRWRDGSRPIPHGVKIVLRLLAIGRVTVAEVKTAAEDAILLGNRRIAEELRKVPKAKGGGQLGKGGFRTQAKSSGRANTGIKKDTRSRLGKLAERSDAEVETAAPQVRRIGELMEEERKSGKLAKGAKGNPGGRGAKVVRSPDTTTQTLESRGIDKNLAKEARGMNGSARPGPPAPLPLAPAPAAAPATTAEKVAALASDACHWPCGDPMRPDFHFCCDPVATPPYCDAHRASAYKAPPSARGIHRVMRSSAASATMSSAW